MINIVFLYVGLQISGAIRLFNKGQQSLVEGESEEKMPVLRVMQEIQFRKKSMFNMWVIILSIFFAVTFQGIYSLILFFFSDSECIV